MHREDNQEIEQFHCEVCSSILKTKDYLRHARYRFMCSMCQKMFNTKEHLKEQEKHHTGEKRTPKCPVCGFLTKENKSHVQIHMKIPSNASPWKCEKCKYYFRCQTDKAY